MMVKNSLLSIVVFCAVSLGCSKADPGFDEQAETVAVNYISDDMAAVRDYVPLFAVIAHRGTTYWAPEETEASWRWAREMGADYLESDLQCTKDGIVVANHDDALKRTTNIEAEFGGRVPEIRVNFYRSFRNDDGSQHFTEEDIAAQIAADEELGVGYNIRDYYYAELLVLDAGSWFNAANPDRARSAFASSGDAMEKSLKSGGIVYGDGMYVSALNDQIAFAEGKRLKRDAEGRRVLPYGIKEEYRDMTLAQIRERADSRYMDFVEYDFGNAYVVDEAYGGHLPGIYIEFKSSDLQPEDMQARVYSVLDAAGWNIITKPCAKDAPFYVDGKVRVGQTNGKVILQTFKFEAMENVEKVFGGRVPMCYLVDEDAAASWNPDNYYQNPDYVAEVVNVALNYMCHIMGPSVSGEPNNYPENNNPWQARIVRRAGMLSHPWSIDNEDQMKTDMDGFFTNRTDMSLKYMIDNGLRGRADIPHPFYENRTYDNSAAPVTVPDVAEVFSRLGY